VDDKEYKHQWYLRNRERLIAGSKKWYRQARKDPEKLERMRQQRCESAKRYATNHRDKIREYNRVYQPKWNKTKKGKAVQKRWRNSKKGKASFWKYRRSPKGRMTSRNIDIRLYHRLKHGAVTIEQWLWLLRYFRHACAYCREPFGKNNAPEMDHIVPLSSRKAKHDAKNVVPSCRSCNASKTNKTADDFLKRKGWKRQWVNRLPLPVPDLVNKRATNGKDDTQTNN
jgi:hypothetical protein